MSVHVMSAALQGLLDAFERLPEDERRDAAIGQTIKPWRH
jgi:hypothetical protein